MSDSTRMSKEEYETALNLCEYFWENYGRLDGHSSWTKEFRKALKKRNPSLHKAWKKLKTSKEDITNLLKYT